MIVVDQIEEHATQSTLNRLLVLHRELDLQEKEVSKLSEVDVLEGYTGWFDVASKCFEDKVVFGAWVEGSLVGFISCKTVEGYIGFVGIVSLLYVTPQYQRMGVGKKLWEEALEYFGKDIDHVTLDVYMGNKVAIDFYKSLGFKPYLYSMAYKCS